MVDNTCSFHLCVNNYVCSFFAVNIYKGFHLTWILQFSQCSTVGSEGEGWSQEIANYNDTDTS